MAQTAREKELYDLAYGSVLNGAQAEKPVYAGTFEGQLNDIFGKIQNREKFSYDVNADPLYQNYKDQYIQGGKLAMKDTMGQAAALTGGYGSTYGQQVGQQAYDAYLQNLSAVIPELYGMAYKKYQDEGDQLKDLYGLVGQQRDAEYGRYRDALGDWERGQQAVRDMEAMEHDRRMQAEAIAREQERYDYEKAWNEDQRAYERNRYAEETEYERRMAAEAIARQLEQQEYERNRYAEETAYNRQKYDEEVARKMDQQAFERQREQENAQWEFQKYLDQAALKQEQQTYERQQDARANLLAIIKASGYRPSDAELQAAGVSREEANALANEFDRQLALEELAREAAAYGGSGGSSGGRSSGGGGRSYNGGDGSYIYDESLYDNYSPDDVVEETYYPGEYERYLRNSIAAETGRDVNKVTAGEVGWNDTARMLNTLGITASNNANKSTTTATKSTTTAPKSNTVVNKTTGNSTAAQAAYEAAKRAEEQKKKKQKANGGR